MAEAHLKVQYNTEKQLDEHYHLLLLHLRQQQNASREDERNAVEKGLLLRREALELREHKQLVERDL